MLKQAEERGLTSEYLLAIGYQLAFVRGDTAQMALLVKGAMGKPGTEDLMLSLQADTEAWYGRFRAADKFTRQAIDSARRNDAQETAAAYQVQAALREATSGNLHQARADADSALKLAQNSYVLAMAALSLATIGDTAAAERLAAQLDRTASLNTIVQRYWLPAIGAAVALRHNDPDRAIERLQLASGMELSEYPNLVPDYFRGQAYLLFHDGNRAAVEFQKFIDHRGPVINQPLGALARLQLGRAFVLSGDEVRAKVAYQDFLTLWKDADSDIPVLRQAKTEYANLRLATNGKPVVSVRKTLYLTTAQEFFCEAICPKNRVLGGWGAAG